MTEPSMPPRRLYAHRGAGRELPENTLPAFRLALEVGATALETDLHRTRDGHIVLSHDPTVARTAGVQGVIEEATLAEVRSWDVGAVMRRAQPEIGGATFSIPTLEELLVEAPGLPINVDIKVHDADTAEAVVRLIRRMKAQERVNVASFDAATLEVVRRLGYEGTTALASAELWRLRFFPAPILDRFPLRGTMAQMPTRLGPIVLDSQALITKAHALRLRVDYWTINDPAEAERLLALGADGIMTDDPRRIAPAFRRSGAA